MHGKQYWRCRGAATLTPGPRIFQGSKCRKNRQPLLRDKIHVKGKHVYLNIGGAKKSKKGKNVEKFLCRIGSFQVPLITP